MKLQTRRDDPYPARIDSARPGKPGPVDITRMVRITIPSGKEQLKTMVYGETLNDALDSARLNALPAGEYVIQHPGGDGIAPFEVKGESLGVAVALYWLKAEQ